MAKPCRPPEPERSGRSGPNPKTPILARRAPRLPIGKHLAYTGRAGLPGYAPMTTTSPLDTETLLRLRPPPHHSPPIGTANAAARVGPNYPPPDFPTVSLFSGSGGLDLGLDAVGFDSRFATDVDPYSCVSLQWGKSEAARRNKGLFERTTVVREDIRALDSSFILEAASLSRGDVALLAGGPPCQAFSVFGKRRGREDDRGMLVYEYLRLLARLEPENFVFENVYGLLSVEGGAVFRDLCQKLEEPKKGLRYTLSVLRMDAANYGVPQYRDRVFIIGSRSGKKVPPPDFITGRPETSGLFPLKRLRTVRDALRGLPPIRSAYPPNHTGRTHSDRIITRYADMKPGQRDHFTRINKLDLDRPSFTIIVGSDKGGGKGHVHPVEPREVTPRESARIQTFPDWWAFSGSVRHPIRQVGNAVPPLLAAALGNALRVALFDRPSVPFATILERLDQTHLFAEDV